MNINLEKLFLFCLVLFGLLVAFLLGLYFDLGDIVFAFLHPSQVTKLGISVSDKMLREVEGEGKLADLRFGRLLDNRNRESDGGFGGGGGGSQAEEAAAADYCGVPPPFTHEMKVSLRRRDLVSRGYTDAEFLEMESQDADRGTFNDVVAELAQLHEAGRYGDAISLVTSALNQLDANNLMVQRDYLKMLVALYLESKQLDIAKETSLRALNVGERILTIERRGYGAEEYERIDAALLDLKESRANLDNQFLELKDRMEQTGSPVVITSKEKSDMREELLKSRQDGEITDGEVQAMLKEIDK